MCIRDRVAGIHSIRSRADVEALRIDLERASKVVVIGAGYVCLLYTSDAADERSSVDLGGPRII